MPMITREQAGLVYSAIVAADARFINLLAREAIDGSVETLKSMWEDNGVKPNDDDVRNMAHGFVSDMLVDFRTTLLEAIRTVQFKANIETELKSDLKFDDE